MKKDSNIIYLSIFSIVDMALKFKADSTYTKESIKTILFFAWVDGLIDSHQYESLAELSETDLEGFHSYLFKKINFN